MVKIIMHGCNGHMGQVISGLVEKDPDAEIVAGIDVADQGKNSYPVYTNMEECQVEADALSTSLLQKQQMHFLLTVRNANSRLYYVQRFKRGAARKGGRDI